MLVAMMGYMDVVDWSYSRVLHIRGYDVMREIWSQWSFRFCRGSIARKSEVSRAHVARGTLETNDDDETKGPTCVSSWWEW